MTSATFDAAGVGRRTQRRLASGLVGALAVALLALTTAPAAAQNTGTVTGTIAQGTGQPLGGTQVFLVGTGLGTLSNANGRFIILNVPAGSYTIRGERIGYRAAEQEITVRAGQTVTVDITLNTEALGLDEIVVTGAAGAARRREIGNTVSQIDVAELPEPATSVDALLQARAPGLTVMQSSGSIGGGAMIRLRGNNSVSMSNQPIIYIDGVRVRSEGYQKNVPPVGYQGRSNNDIASPLGDINPNDIERIEVIKGAAATTLYGTEAAAGVIQIFTKRGHTGAARWTAQIDQGFATTLPFGVDPDTRPPSEPAQVSSGGTSDFLFINPWLRNGHRQKYFLSVAGGSDDLRYFVSGQWEDNEGTLPNDAQQKGILRGNFTFSPLDNLQVVWNTSYTNNEIESTAAGNNAHGLTLNAFRRDRNYLGEESFEAINGFTNQDITTDIKHLVSGLTVNYSPLSFWTNRVTAGLDLAQVDARNLRPFGFIRAPDGILADRRNQNEIITIDYVGTLDFELTDQIQNSFSFGGQAISTEDQETVAYGEDFPGPGEPDVDAAGTTLGFEDRERVVNAGFFFQDLVSIKDRWFFTGGIRVDGNSAFGSDLGLQAYPKASVSYVISDESFFPDIGELKVRGAWGQSGRAPGAFDAVRTFDPVGFGGAPAFFPENVGNAELGPERTTELELGFDGSFIDNRFTLEFTWYNATTSDALFDVRQIPSLGFLESQLANVGELRNRGIEIAANASIIQGRNFSWDLGGNVSTNRSEVTDLGGAPDFSLGDEGWIVLGQPAPVIRVNCVTNPDAIAEPVIEQDCNVGPNQPTTIVGLNTTLQLPAGILLTARGEFQGGHYMSDGAAWNAIRRSVRWPGCFDYYRIQETQGRDATTALQRAQCDVQIARQDFLVYPADFMKLREVTLRLPIPSSWIPSTQTASLTLSGRNIWKWVNDDFPVFEPEMSGNVGFNETVRSILEHVPPPAIWTASVRVTF